MSPGFYPISTLTFLIIPKDGKDAQKRAALKQFIQYVVTDGQQTASGLSYAPLALRSEAAGCPRLEPTDGQRQPHAVAYRQGKLRCAVNEQTIPRARFLLVWHGRLRFAISHISRKTREIWGTLDSLLGESQTVAVHCSRN